MKPWFALPVALLAACASGPTGREGAVTKPAAAPALARSAGEASSTTDAAAEKPKPLAYAFAPEEREELDNRGYYTREGQYEGLAYSILFNSNRELVNGSVDGPQPSWPYASDDPDRWSVLTDVDEMTDERSWQIVHHRSSLMFVMQAPRRPTAVCLYRADFPGRSFAVRVGKRDMISFNNKGCASGPSMKKLFAQMMEGGEFITRGYEWPDDYPQDEKGDAMPFRHAHDLFKHMYELVQSNAKV